MCVYYNVCIWSHLDLMFPSWIQSCPSMGSCRCAKDHERKRVQHKRQHVLAMEKSISQDVLATPISTKNHIIEGGENALLLLTTLAISCMMLPTTLMMRVSNRSLGGFWTRKLFETSFQNLLCMLKTLNKSWAFLNPWKMFMHNL